MMSIIYQAAVYVSVIRFQLAVGLHISERSNRQVKIKKNSCAVEIQQSASYT